ncbi:hypothetical protein ACFODZ_16500 [Marinicella sediminis]|uniref:Uncharacterized protein n=1 Tax=Marinicella sediminis TaxID=1792834 RepID=A0ABV7JCQ9_9GAMM
MQDAKVTTILNEIRGKNLTSGKKKATFPGGEELSNPFVVHYIDAIQFRERCVYLQHKWAEQLFSCLV